MNAQPIDLRPFTYLREKWLKSEESNLNNQYFNKFEKLVKKVVTKLPNSSKKKDDVFYQLYDHYFYFQIEKSIYDLISLKYLSIKERFTLLSSAWLFYSGYSCVDKNPSEGHEKEKVSEEYIRKLLKSIKHYNIEEINAIVLICKYTNHFDLEKLPIISSNDLRLRLIGGCLLIAETFHESFSLEEQPDLLWANNLFTQLIPKESNSNADVYFHWLKRNIAIQDETYRDVKPSLTHPSKKGKNLLNVTSFAIKNIYEKNENFANNLNKSLSTYFRIKLSSFKKVISAYNRIAQSDKDILEINNIVERNKINFHSTYVHTVPVHYDGKIRPNIKTIELVTNIINHQKSSAGTLAKDFANIIIYLIERIDDRNKAIIAINKFDDFILTRYLRENRPCHVILKKIHELIKDINIQSLDFVKAELTRFIKEREQVQENVYKSFKTFLRQIKSIFVFGYSETIIGSLKRYLKDNDFENQDETVIYVGACESKNRFNFMNEFEYCDGLKYRQDIEDLGFKNVILIPDNCIGNIINRRNINDEESNSKENGKPNNAQYLHHIDTVLLGANGINPVDNTFGHTAGHEMIVGLALRRNIPVFVLADSWKIGTFNYNPDVTRKSKWLPDPNFEFLIDQGKIFNPRESSLPLFPDRTKGVQYIITDKGFLINNKIKDSMISNFNSIDDAGNSLRQFLNGGKLPPLF